MERLTFASWLWIEKVVVEILLRDGVLTDGRVSISNAPITMIANPLSEDNLNCFIRNSFPSFYSIL